MTLYKRIVSVGSAFAFASLTVSADATPRWISGDTAAPEKPAPVLVKEFTAAIAVVMGLILLMGIKITTCNPVILVFGVVTVSVLFWICASI